MYTYFPDKAALVKAVVERLLGEVAHAVEADGDQPWRVRLVAMAMAVRERLTAHPGAVPLMVGGPMDGPHALALGERLLEILESAGLDPVAAARASYLLIVYAFGSMALEVADLGRVGPLPPESERVADRLAVFGATPAEYFPRSAAVVPTMAAYISTEQYLWGLDRLLAGLVSPARQR